MEALGLDIKLMIAQIVNFVLFMILFAKFIAPPFRDFLHKSKIAEEEKDRALHDIQKREEQIIEEQKQVVSEARSKSALILKDAEEQATQKRQEILEKAQKEADEVKKKARVALEDEKKQLYASAKEYIVRTSNNLVESALADIIDSKAQKQILEHVTKEIKTKKVYEN